MDNSQLEGESGEAGVTTSSLKNNLLVRFGAYKWSLVAVVVCVALFLGAFVLWNKEVRKEEAAEVYTLVHDKISASAPITVLLPEESSVANFDPARAITFSPAIKGSWEASSPTLKNVFRFLPEKKLTVGAYHLVTLDTPELKIEKMFSVDSDPSVLAVFPKQETEVNEYSNITIMFSRPMVALSTLSENADILPPVVITPATEGRFKWITTRTLQFIPAKRLVRSASYQVKVNNGMQSFDGVPVPAFTHNFTTRALNYRDGYYSYGQVTLTHDRPIRLYFNQPFDLEKTKSQIRLVTSSNIPKSFVAAYGTREVYDEKSLLTKTLTDQSVLEIYSESDMYGRKHLWDFDTAYQLVVSGAVPIEGDVKLSIPRNVPVAISPIILSMHAESPRSALVSPERFDPTGTLVFRMSEPIDLPASRINGKGITKIAYGQKCAEVAVGVEMEITDEDCKKVDDQEVIVASFDAKLFGMHEASAVVFDKLVNSDGVTLMKGSLTKSFTTFPKFEIISTTPVEGSVEASLKELQICSTNPLVTPSDDEFYKKVRSNMMIGMWNWQNSYLVTPNNSAYSGCPINSFHTKIRYGLVPKFAYELTLDLGDHFGSQLTKILHFTTKDADPLEKGFSHLQSMILMTPPDRTTFTYGLDFMNEMDMTICKVTPETMLSLRAFPRKATDGPSSLSCISETTKHLVLPQTYATRKYLQINLKDYYPDTKGNYILSFSNPGYRQVIYSWDYVAQQQKYTLGEKIYEETYVTVTDLAVASKQVERSDTGWYKARDKGLRNTFMNDKWPTNLYWVNHFTSLTPVVGALVTPYTEEGTSITKHASKKTDAEGIAEMASADNIVGAVITHGGDSAIVSNRSDALTHVQSAGPARREYMYTDRPIYRPGDTVHIKGISRIGYDGQFEIPTGKTSVEVRDAQYKSARKEEVKFNNNGTYELSFVLDSKAPLGYYSLESGTGGYGSFQVEEYVAPQFKIDVTPDKEEYISGNSATILLDAKYYFGVPVQSGDVEYRIVSQDYYFDRYQDGYFNFGAGWYDNDYGWYGDRFLTSGKLKLSKDGKGTITQELNIDKLFSGNNQKQSKIFTLHVTVKNENGQSVTKQKSFIVHRGAFYAGLTMDDYFYGKGQKGTVRIKTVDTKGKPIQKDDLTLTLQKVEWKSYRRQEVDGNFYYRTERVATKVTEVTVDTDNSGNGSYEFVAGDGGEYEFVISGSDGENNVVTSQYDFYVSDNSPINIRPTNNESLELVSEKTELKVGDTGAFVIKSPYPRAKALVTVARGNTYERKVLDITSQLTRYQFPIIERYIPNVSASVLLLSSDPEIKYGEVRYTVGTIEKELDIKVTPNKKSYLPGEEVTLQVSVKDSTGKPVAAELSLSVVDMSVLALVGNPKKHPVTFFYGGEPLTIRTAMNIKNVLNVAEIPLGTKGGSGGEGDDLEKKKRGEFRDTAHWEGTMVTDAMGSAIVTFTLPDNLTEWQVESVGITKDTKIGAGYGDFTSRKSIMASPLKPRFILPGDSFAVGGTIFNETETTQRLTVSVTAPMLSLTGEREVVVSIEPHTSISVSFPAIAPEKIIDGKHEFTLSAKNENYEDVVTSTFPIERNDTYEYTASAGRIDEANWKEHVYLPKNVLPDRGSLTITTSATMATILDSAIRQMIIYPYECSEQTGSKLRTIAIVKQNAALFGTTTPMLPETVTIGTRTFTIDQIVDTGLAKLYQNQAQDGGMPYYPGLRSDYSLTLSTLETYIELKKAGYKVDETKLAQSAQYVYNAINFAFPGRQIQDEDIILGAYVLSKLKDPARYESAATRARLVAYAADKTFVHNKLSTHALAYLAILSAQKEFGMLTTSRLFAEFENRSNIDARGTTVNSNGNMLSYYFENPITNTALALKAFSEAKRDSPLLEGYLRAIKTGKAREGGWASTHNTITVIDAMTEYLKWKDEANAHMSLAIMLDGTPLISAEITKQNVLTTYATSVSMSNLRIGKNQVVEFVKKNLGMQNSIYYYDMLLRYYLPTASIAPRDEGFSVRRELYAIDDTEFANPRSSATQGELLRGRVIISVPKFRTHVTIEDFIPAGTEIVNQRFATEDQGLGETNIQPERYGAKKSGSLLSRGLAGVFASGQSVGPKTDTDGVVSDEMYGNRSTILRSLYPNAVENHDDRIFAYIGELGQGEYVYEYYLRALIPGTYQYLPLVVSELYTPENFGRTRGSTFTVLKKEE